MRQVELKAQIRECVGRKGVNRRLRANGQVQAILYGDDKENIAISVDSKELAQIILSGENVVINITVCNNSNEYVETVILREYQLHPYKNEILHADFYRISLDKKIEVSVPLEFVGTAIGQKEGGVLDILIREVDVRALPLQMPEKIKVDISSMKIGDILQIKDIPISEEIEILTEADLDVVTITMPTIEEPEVTEEAEEEVSAEEEEEPKEPEVIKKGKIEKEEEE